MSISWRLIGPEPNCQGACLLPKRLPDGSGCLHCSDGKLEHQQPPDPPAMCKGLTSREDLQLYRRSHLQHGSRVCNQSRHVRDWSRCFALQRKP